MVQEYEFTAFLRIVDAETVQFPTREHDYRAFIKDEIAGKQAAIEVEWLQDRHTDPVIRCSSRTVGARGSFGIEAPAKEWQISQAPDDHNLLTELKLPESNRGTSAVVSVYGPPARYDSGTIKIEGGDDEAYRFSDVVAAVLDESDDGDTRS